MHVERVLYTISAFSRTIHAGKTLNFHGLGYQMIEASCQTHIQEVAEMKQIDQKGDSNDQQFSRTNKFGFRVKLSYGSNTCRFFSP